MQDDPSTDAETSQTTGSRDPLPVLYKNPELVNLERHRHSGLSDTATYSFARETNSVPVGADEFYALQAHMPIVFTESDPASPVAVLGVGSNRNNFVDDDGKWRVGVPIPAYIRRYPFILAQIPGREGLHLAIDEGAPHFIPNGGRPLFGNGAPSTLAQQALNFCSAFQAQLEAARGFGEGVHAAGLLVEKRADVRLSDGRLCSLEHFRVIDEPRFDAMNDETFLAWRKRKWLGFAYAHLLSMRSWEGVGRNGPTT